MLSFCCYTLLCLLVLNSIDGSTTFTTAKLPPRFVRQVDNEGDGQIDQCVEESAPPIMEEIPDSKAAESFRIRVAAKKTPAPEPITTPPSPTPGTVKILGPEVGFFRSVTHHLHEIAEKEHTAAKEREAEKSAPKGAKSKDPKIGTPKSVEKDTFKPTLFIKTKKPDIKLKTKEPKNPLRINIRRNKDRIGSTGKLFSIREKVTPDSLTSSSRLRKPILPNLKSNKISKRPLLESIGPSASIARPPPGFTDVYDRKRKTKFGLPKLNNAQRSGDFQDSMVSATNLNKKEVKVLPNRIDEHIYEEAQGKISGNEQVVNKNEPTYQPESRKDGSKEDSDSITDCSNTNSDYSSAVKLSDANIHDKAAEEISDDLKNEEKKEELAMKNDEALKKVLENTSTSYISDDTPLLHDRFREGISSDSEDIARKKVGEEMRNTIRATNSVNGEHDNIISESEKVETNLLDAKTDERNPLSKITKNYSDSRKRENPKKPVSLDDFRKRIDSKMNYQKSKLQAAKIDSLSNDNLKFKSIDKSCEIPLMKGTERVETRDYNTLSESLYHDDKLANTNTDEINSMPKMTKEYSGVKKGLILKKPLSLIDIRKLINTKKFDLKPKLRATVINSEILPIKNLKHKFSDTSCDKPQTRAAEPVGSRSSDNTSPESMHYDANSTNYEKETLSEIRKKNSGLRQSPVFTAPDPIDNLRKLIASKRHNNKKVQDDSREVPQLRATALIERNSSDNNSSKSVNDAILPRDNNVKAVDRNTSSEITKEFGVLSKNPVGKRTPLLNSLRKVIESKRLHLKSNVQASESEPDFNAKENLKLDSQDIPCKTSQMGGSESTENTVPDNILSGSINYETKLPIDTVNMSGRNVLSEAKGDDGGFVKSTLAGKMLHLPDIRKIFKSNTLRLSPRKSHRGSKSIPNSLAKNNMELECRNTSEDTAKPLSSSHFDNGPLKSINEEPISSNPTISAKKKLSTTTKDYSELLNIPLVKKRISSTKLMKKRMKPNNENFQDKILASERSANAVNESVKEKLRDSGHAVPLDSDTAGSNVETRSKTNIQLAIPKNDMRKNTLPCMETIRKIIQLKKNRLMLSAPKPSSISGRDKASTDNLLTDNILQASEIHPKIMIVPKQDTKTTMQDTELVEEFRHNLEKPSLKKLIKIKPPGSISKTNKIGLVRTESKDINECIDSNAEGSKNIVSTALGNPPDETSDRNVKIGISNIPHTSLNSPVKQRLYLGSSKAKNVVDKLRDSHKFMRRNEGNIPNSIKSNESNTDKTLVAPVENNNEALGIAPKIKLQQSFDTKSVEECDINKNLGSLKSNLEDIDSQYQIEADNTSAASDNIQTTKKVEPSQHKLVKDFIKERILRLAQKHNMEKSVGNSPTVRDENVADILAPDDDGSAVLEPLELLDTTPTSRSPPQNILGKRPSKLGKSKPISSEAREGKKWDIPEASHKNLSDTSENAPSDSVTLRSSNTPTVGVERNFKAASKSGKRKSLLLNSNGISNGDLLSEKEGECKGIDGDFSSRSNNQVIPTGEKSIAQTEFLKDDGELSLEFKKSDDPIPGSSSIEPKLSRPEPPINKSEEARMRDAKKSLDTIRDFLKSKKKMHETSRLSKDTDISEIGSASEPKPNGSLTNIGESVLRESYPRATENDCFSPALGSELNGDDLARMKSGNFILECRLTPKNCKDFR